MIGLCTDSNSQLPQSLAERYDVEVVPVTVTVNDHDYLEGVDLDADVFYDMLSADPPPRVSTSQPSPGQFAAAYDTLLQRGCDEILSIHVTAADIGHVERGALGGPTVADTRALGRLGHRRVRRQLLRVVGGRCNRSRGQDRRSRAGRRIADTAHRRSVRRRPVRTSSAPVTSPAGVPVMTVQRRTSQRRVAGRERCRGGRGDGVDGDRLGHGLNVAVGMADRAGEAADSRPSAMRCAHRQRARGRALPHRAERRRVRRAGHGRVLHVPRCVAGSPSARTAQSSNQLKKL